ncbi:MAG: type II toxin-antitoxin system VapC family toxin [Candidatus Desantisbacteria bacterium]
MKYFLDTTVLIDYLKGCEDVVDRIKHLARQGAILGCCCINITELYRGLREKEKQAAEKLINHLHYFEITPKTAKIAGEYQNEYGKKGITLSLANAIIGATAVTNKAVLLTANIKHYPMTELTVERL